jgi:hypothetical protein
LEEKTKNAAIEEKFKNLEEKFKFMENEQKEINKVSINLKINLDFLKRLSYPNETYNLKNQEIQNIQKENDKKMILILEKQIEEKNKEV